MGPYVERLNSFRTSSTVAGAVVTEDPVFALLFDHPGSRAQSSRPILTLHADTMVSDESTVYSAKTVDERIRSIEPASYISPIYTLFFLYIEPFTALLGFLVAYTNPHLYLALTDHTYLSQPAPTSLSPSAFVPFITQSASILLPSSGAPAPPLATRIALAQLSNLYLFFALNELLVLHTTNGFATRYKLPVWRALLTALLVADVGHLWSVKELGLGVYWRVWEWNCMDWGNVGVVYVGMGLRMAFLSGLGVEG